MYNVHHTAKRRGNNPLWVQNKKVDCTYSRAYSFTKEVELTEL